MSEINFQVHDKILLTGAGFTHNFGAPLARDVWASIFTNRHVQSRPRVRELLLNNFDFESVYQEITDGNDYERADKDAMKVAVDAAYESIDLTIRNFLFADKSSVNIYSVNELIGQFAPPRSTRTKGMFFTLNQDLFIERMYTNDNTVSFPGIQVHHNLAARQGQPLEAQDWCRLPTRSELENLKGALRHEHFLYFKLHGSHDWLDSGGTNKLIIGTAKEKSIQQEPLLEWYFEIFRAALMQPERKLLVVGYGFRDAHINDVIAEAVNKSHLRFYVVNPAPISRFHEEIMLGHRGNEIWYGLAGYFPHSLREIFPGDQSKTGARKNIYENFFEIPQPR